jgi:hypothetical protein
MVILIFLQVTFRRDDDVVCFVRFLWRFFIDCKKCRFTVTHYPDSEPTGICSNSLVTCA